MFAVIFLHVCLYIACAILGLYLIVKIYIRYTVGWCKSQLCLVGKTAIVTGANTGIGYETALDFAKRGSRVILACRNRQKAEEARLKIIEETGNEDILVRIIDMASFESVRLFAKDILNTETRLDILVNNAGVAVMKDQRTIDGHLTVIQVNYLSSFLLTNLLIGLLKRSGPSRVINVSSMMAKFAIFFNISKLDRYQNDLFSYSYSKLANILFTKELGRRLKGTQVTTYSLHPGCISTQIYKNLHGLAEGFFFGPLFVSLEEGTQTILHTALARGIEGHSGEHFENCERVSPYLTSQGENLGEFWDKTKEMIQMKDDEIII